MRREFPIRTPFAPPDDFANARDTAQEMRLQMSNLDLLSEMPVLNRTGENRSTENEIRRHRPSPVNSPTSTTLENNDILRPRD